MKPSESLRRALKAMCDAGVTIYVIAKATDIDNGVIARFISGERQQIRSGTIDKLCEYLGLELRPASEKLDNGDVALRLPKRRARAASRTMKKRPKDSGRKNV